MNYLILEECIKESSNCGENITRLCVKGLSPTGSDVFMLVVVLILLYGILKIIYWGADKVGKNEEV